VQRCAGYTLTGETREDKWFIAHGKNGREGKGTIYGAWAAAMGDYILELPSSALDLKNPKDYDLANLPGKRFVTSSESGNTIHLNHDRIKKLSGGDLLRAANKYQLSFEFLPSCKLWLACNDLPTVTDDSRAFWSRVIVIPFRRSFYGSENVGLRPALRGEGQHREAVLAWMVKGAMDYAREGLGPMPFAIAEATNAFRDESCP
jgi:putative DNA primase/helicase